MKKWLFILGLFLLSSEKRILAYDSIDWKENVQAKKTAISYSELPIIVREVMKTEGFRGWKPTEIYRIEDRVTYFEIHLENAQAQKSIIKLTELGREIK